MRMARSCRVAFCGLLAGAVLDLAGPAGLAPGPVGLAGLVPGAVGLAGLVPGAVGLAGLVAGRAGPGPGAADGLVRSADVLRGSAGPSGSASGLAGMVVGGADVGAARDGPAPVNHMKPALHSGDWPRTAPRRRPLAMLPAAITAAKSWRGMGIGDWRAAV